MTKKLLKRVLQLIKEEKGDFKVLMTALGIILLAFFVLLNSLATIEKEKTEMAAESIKKSFGVLPGDLKSMIGIGQRPSTEIKVLGIPELETHLLSRELEKHIMREKLGKDFGFFTSDQKTTFSFSEKAAFGSGSAELGAPVFSILNKIAVIINRAGGVVHIEGHTDNVPISTRKYQSNWELSTARAVNTLKYLVEKGKVDPTKVAAAGLGDSRPIFKNDSLLNRNRNRRVEIILLTNQREL